VRALDPETPVRPAAYFAELHAAGTRAVDEGAVMTVAGPRLSVPRALVKASSRSCWGCRACGGR
jgi:hypothetical protein